jgi:4-hydroxybenzoate polyprenyltransferase
LQPGIFFSTGFILKLLRRIGHYFLFGNIFIAACAVSLLVTTCQLTGIPFSWELGAWVFLATFFLYNFDSLLPAKLQFAGSFSPRRSWVLAHRRQLAASVLVAGAAVLCIFFRAFQPNHFWLLLHLALISMLYSLPVVPRRNGWVLLRNIPLLKLFLIAYVWACVTVWLPLLAGGWDIGRGEGWHLFIQRFLFIFPLTILFDIRDVVKDEVTDTLTLPRLVGVGRAKMIAWGILLAYLVLVSLTLSGSHRLALLLCGLVYGVVIGLAHKGRSEYFYALAADGVLVLPMVVLWWLNG